MIGSGRGRAALLTAAWVLSLAGWLVVVATVYQLTQTPQFTEAYVPRQGLAWAVLFSVLSLVNTVFHPIIGPDRIVGPTVAAFTLGLGLVSAAYISAVLLLERWPEPGRLGTTIVVLGSVVFAALLAWMPGLLSTDVQSYAIFGRLADTHGVNPYGVTAAAFADDTLISWSDSDWRTQTTPYGPVWTTLSWLLAWITRGANPVTQILAFKGVALVAFLGSVGLAWRLTGRLSGPRGRQPAGRRLAAFALFAWNPLLLFETVGNAHNDGLLVLLLFAALAALAGQTVRWPSGVQWALALGWLTLATLAKFVAAIAGLLFVVAWIRRVHSWRDALPLMVSALALLSLVTAVTLPWVQGVSPLAPLGGSALASERHANSLLEVFVGPVIGSLLPRDHNQDGPSLQARSAGEAWALTAGRALCGFTILGAAVWLWRRGGEQDRWLPRLMLATVVALLALLLLGSAQVLAWYFAWPVAVASLLGWRHPVARVTILMGLVFIPAHYTRHFYVEPVQNGVLAAVVLVPALWLGVEWLLKAAPGRGDPDRSVSEGAV